MGVDAEMLVKVKRPITDEEIKRASYELVERFGTEVIWLADDDTFKRRALERVDVWEQDGPDVEPEAGETFLRVSLWGRYYGVNYERGDLSTIVAVAAFLEGWITGCEIWYGGDSSGICIEPFGQRERRILFDHFVRVGHKPYSSYFERQDSPLNDDGVKEPVCDFCGVPMGRYGWGGNGTYAAFHCHGCGRQVETRDRGQSYTETATVGGREVKLPLGEVSIDEAVQRG